MLLGLFEDCFVECMCSSLPVNSKCVDLINILGTSNISLTMKSIFRAIIEKKIKVEELFGANFGEKAQKNEPS
jgi:hypothetical protein